MRRDWTKNEVSDIYHMPLLELIYVIFQLLGLKPREAFKESLIHA